MVRGFRTTKTNVYEGDLNEDDRNDVRKCIVGDIIKIISGKIPLDGVVRGIKFFIFGSDEIPFAEYCCAAFYTYLVLDDSMFSGLILSTSADIKIDQVINYLSSKNLPQAQNAFHKCIANLNINGFEQMNYDNIIFQRQQEIIERCSTSGPSTSQSESVSIDQSGYESPASSSDSYKINHFTDAAKECILCADEMALKSNLYYMLQKDEIIGFHESNKIKTYSPVKYSFVLMIRGINFDWKQPIAYYMVSSSCTGFELQDIIFTIIQKLFQFGLNVKAFVTDMGSNFVSFSNTVNVTPVRTFFLC
ncbi:uncharacterized protein LOC126904238 isoform X3 [Daktulosphaira vitifoliae]|uniref:uncharacterized protein LOC126904238 isoform X3 n=1 Tax=Daktulosphaira vitifoliae TaxID=58002 RepID=UPI0021A9905E|nr:uncharacterized protein LOC126904238 isoform X3 [Daktulosphaira vitifoliae]